MNATFATVLCTPLLVSGLAAQRATQEGSLPKVGSRVPVDASLPSSGDAERDGSNGLPVSPSIGSVTRFTCVPSIRDQVTGGCLTASFSLLYLAPRFIPAAEVSLFLPLETVLGTAAVWWVIGEEPSLQAIIGGLAIITALTINSYVGMRQNRAPQAG